MLPTFIPGHGLITIPMILERLVPLAKSRGWSKQKMQQHLEQLWTKKKLSKKTAVKYHRVRRPKAVELDMDL